MLWVVLLGIGAAAVAAGLWYWSESRRFVERSQAALAGVVTSRVEQRIFFRDVSLWDGRSESLRSHASIEVADGRVVAIGDAADPPPAGALVVDGPGRTLIPGIIDAHVHMMFESGPDLLTRGPALMREWMEIAARYPEGREDVVRRGQLKLKAGVATMRILGDGYYALAYRDDVARWQVVGPRVLAAGLHVNGPNGYVSGGDRRQGGSGAPRRGGGGAQELRRDRPAPRAPYRARHRRREDRDHPWRSRIRRRAARSARGVGAPHRSRWRTPTGSRLPPTLTATRETGRPSVAGWTASSTW